MRKGWVSQGDVLVTPLTDEVPQGVNPLRIGKYVETQPSGTTRTSQRSAGLQSWLCVRGPCVSTASRESYCLSFKQIYTSCSLTP